MGNFSEQNWGVLRERCQLALGSTTLSASSLAQQLISEVSASPSVIDGAVLCPGLTVGIAIASAVLPPTDSALQLLVARRMQVLERLNDEIDERTFIQPDIADFDPDVEPTPVRTYLTSFEALLLDFGLASRDESKPWLLFEEAQKLFGKREESAIAVGDQRVSRTRGWLALLTTLLAIAAGGFLRFGLTTLKVRPGIANAGAISLCAAILVVAVVVSPGRDSRTRESSGLFFVVTSLLSAVVAVNQSMKKPFLGDVAGLVLGTGLAALAAVVWFTIKRQDS